MMLDFLIAQYGSKYFFVVDVNGDGNADAYILSGKEQKKSLHIYSIALRPDVEGEGWGKKILKYLIGIAMTDGFARIILEVREDNDRAQILYQDLGWKIVGKEGNYYNDGATAIKMELLL
jgi:ribosomal protein S18 acetylase RimI-like enzyme